MTDLITLINKHRDIIKQKRTVKLSYTDEVSYVVKTLHNSL